MNFFMPCIPNVDVLVANISHGFFRFDFSLLIFRFVIELPNFFPMEIGGS